MKKDCLSVSGVEHRHWHNTYGMYMQRATAEGLELVRRGNSPFGVGEDGRPFVLSRSFFAGSQRWGAIWTGDNAARCVREGFGVLGVNGGRRGAAAATRGGHAYEGNLPSNGLDGYLSSMLLDLSTKSCSYDIYFDPLMTLYQES